MLYTKTKKEKKFEETYFLENFKILPLNNKASKFFKKLTFLYAMVRN